MSHQPPQFWQAVAEFNQQQFYQCHDILEALWLESVDPDKTFYQGILQVAVGCYHLGNGNLRGAMILLGEGSRKLKTYQPTYGDIEVDSLWDQSQELLQYLQQLTPEQQQSVTATPAWPNIVRVETS